MYVSFYMFFTCLVSCAVQMNMHSLWCGCNVKARPHGGRTDSSWAALLQEHLLVWRSPAALLLMEKCCHAKEERTYIFSTFNFRHLPDRTVNKLQVLILKSTQLQATAGCVWAAAATCNDQMKCWCDNVDCI